MSKKDVERERVQKIARQRAERQIQEAENKARAKLHADRVKENERKNQEGR